MADQCRSTDQEWCSWWDASTAAHSTLAFSTWRRPRGTVYWPTAAQQSRCQPPSAAANAPVPMNTNAPLQDTRSSVQDAFAQTHSSAQDTSTQSVQTHSSAQDPSTQLSWTIQSRRRISSKKRSRTPDPRLDSYASPLSRPSPVNAGQWAAPPLLCSSRFAGPPGLPPPPDAVRLRSTHYPSQAATLATNAGCQYHTSGTTQCLFTQLHTRVMESFCVDNGVIKANVPQP